MMRLARLLFALVLAVCVLPSARMLVAQQSTDPAMLVADDVYLSGENRLTAYGNVEALYDGRRLQASEITYDQKTETLIIKGPITLHEQNNTLILADSGELDRDMRNGILRGARIVMQNQVQLAAHAMARRDGRYNKMYKAAVTSCRVCKTGRPPLWQIRARRVVHDQQEKQLYFDDAQFQIMDVPVFYMPRLRLPDPTLERATGFLIPSLHNSTQLGFGVRVPYFIRIGDHKDLTLTPFISANSLTLEARYRQAFRNGRIEFEGAISDDNFGPRSTRGYIFGHGAFELPQDFNLTFNLEAVRDDTYLLDYGYSDKDRLQSELAIERVERDEYIRGALTHFYSLRSGESNSTLPSIVGNAEYERRFHPDALGGEFRFSALAHSHYRSSSSTTDVAVPDGWADGRDVTRLTLNGDWMRNWTLPGGLRARVQTGLALDSFHIAQSGTLSRSEATETTPSAALRLRWPLLKTERGGATQVLEPTLQLAWVGGSNPNIPNDESTLIEFDEGNLFAMSRFTAPDRRERGLTGAYGISWTRIDPKGWQASFAVGQVVHEDRQLEVSGLETFTDSSGLNGKFSDVLFAGQFKNDNGLTITARSLFDDAFDTTKAEARASWQTDRTNLGATYIWLRDDPRENRFGNVSEWAFDASHRLSRHWTGSAEWRYDVAQDRSVRAGVGLKYTNECVDLALSASRRFTSSTILAPSTNISFTVGLRGFTTTTNDKSYVRTCRN
ncbi:LPS-assembly protein LptD [Roseovarius sp. A21]|uniref:LPS-assembly protein LptD n=1 Tax=Roseovarius bejariae TaxID=2576383 RepID=A0A844CTZ4_9RHOB|nr:LPS assembly protein LptD [Roseovarius bejariae]MRU16905.1 LPS-assembly protein LptD [Roseovarius bejariae]